jgi:hypothetical protein
MNFILSSKTSCLALLLLTLLSGGCSQVSSQRNNSPEKSDPAVQNSRADQFKKAEKQSIKVSAEALKNAKERIAESVFHSNFLWTLGQHGILLRVDLEKKKAAPFEFARYVADLYINEKNEFFVLAGERADAADWRILKKNGDDWLEVASLKRNPAQKRENDAEREIIGLAEYQNRLLVLTETEVYRQKTESEWQIVKLQNKGRFGLQTPFAVTDNGFIYVGINHGEFGGGLWRIDLTDGSLINIEKKTVGKICFRPLYTGCDPVTSVVKDAENPNSVLASIGLRHFSEQGRVVRVSADDVSVAFNKIYKSDLESDKIEPANPCEGKNEPDNLENFTSEGVFGMQSDGRSVWLVTGRAIYKFGAGSIETCAKLPDKFENVDGIGISEKVAGVILVGTDINWAKSLSGMTPLIAVKR